MDERCLFFAQLDALSKKLIWVEHVLEDTQQVDEVLYQRLSLSFARLVAAQQSDLQRLKDEAEPRKAKPDWKGLEKAQKDCADLCGESLAFLGGLLLRKYQLDHLTCLIADSLCEYWCETSDVPKGLVAIPATADSFTGLSNIVRVRFPDFSIWSLPIVAHEFGHYLQAKKRGEKFRCLFNDILHSEGRARTLEPDPILEEQFADLIAVYVLGPAYACTCILQEFNPRTAHRELEGYPTDAQRVFFLRRALERLQEHDATKPFSYSITQLEQAWEAAERLTEGLQELGQRFDTLYDVLDNPADQLISAPYRPERWSVVKALKGELARLASKEGRVDAYEVECGVKKVLEGRKAEEETGAAVVPDVLNAAWLWRQLNPGSNPAQVSRVALLACRSLLNQQ